MSLNQSFTSDFSEYNTLAIIQTVDSLPHATTVSQHLLVTPPS